MIHNAKSIRPFIGAKDFDISRSFYRDLGFEETTLGPAMSVFKSGNHAFYLQKHYSKDWVDNTMVFMEVDDTQRVYHELKALNLPSKYQNVRLTPIRNEEWGREWFLHDPTGILGDVGEIFI